MNPNGQPTQPGGQPPVNQGQDQTTQAVMQLAKIAASIPPEVLGMILFNALTEKKLPLNEQGIAELAKPTAPAGPPQMKTPSPFGMPVGAGPAVGGTQ
jgi:hypothetical protein